MGFNATRFKKQQFQPRQEAVEVPALAIWYDQDEEGEHPCKWIVRGLTGQEFARVLDSSNKEKNLSAVIQAIASNQAKLEELKEVVGLGDKTPTDLAKRIEQLVYGSVDPEIDSSIAVKLAETFPIEFYILTNKITALTGQGMDIKK